MKTTISTVSIFYITYFCYVFYRMLNLSQFAIDYGYFVLLISRLCDLLIACCAVLAIYKRYYTYSEFIFKVTFLGIMIFVYFNTGYKTIIEITILIICGSHADYYNTVKVSFSTLLFSFAFVFLFCKAGVIDDVIYYHEISYGTVKAHTLGFTYYTYPAYIILAVSIEWIYLRENRASYFELILVGVIAFCSYFLFSSRASLLMTFLFIILYIILVKIHLLQENSSFLKVVSYCGFFTMFAIILLLLYLYLMGNEFVIKMNDLFSGRFQYLSSALLRYGVNLFGTRVSMIGGYDVLINDSLQYDYIDGGYMYSFFAYGLLYTLLLLLAYTIIFVYAARRNDYMICVWLMIFMVMNMTNNMFTALQYNPLLFLLPNYIGVNDSNQMETG